jgi:uncharacterized membrane protein (Fun14 family)
MSVAPLRVPRRLQYRVVPSARGVLGHSGVIDLSVAEDEDDVEKGKMVRVHARRDYVIPALSFAAGFLVGFSLALAATV